MASLSNSVRCTGIQRFRNSFFAWLHGRWVTLGWAFILFLFFFFNLVTDAVLLQCRHLTAVEAEDLYLSREQIVDKQQQRKVLQLDKEPHTCSAGTVPGCWLPVLLSLPLLPLAHGPVPLKVSRDYAVNTTPTIYFPSMKGNETTCFAYTVLWRAIRWYWWCFDCWHLF